MRTPRWVGLLLFVLVLATLCVWAGRWQLDRWHTKLDRREAVEAAATADPVPLRSLAVPGEPAPPASEYRMATVRGTYDVSGQLLVRNPLGRSGFEVMTPLVTDDGSVLFVDRGWVPLSEQSAATTPDVPAPASGVVDAQVRLRLPRVDSNTNAAPSGQVYGFDVAAWARDSPGPTYQAYGELVDQQPPPTAGLELPDTPDVGLGPHLFYAMQWFLFAGFALVGYVLLLRRDASPVDAQDSDAVPASSVTTSPRTTDS